MSDDVLDKIGENVMSHEWKRLARCLSLTSVDIDAIENKYRRENFPDTCKDMLRMWKKKRGSNAVGAVLAGALHEARLRLLAEKYIQI